MRVQNRRTGLGGCPGSPIGVQDAYNFARMAGFSPDAARTAVAIAMRESGLNPNCVATSVAGSTEASYGLMQINMSGTLGTSRLLQFGISDASALLDPGINMQAAYTLSGGGSNWSPWHIDSDTATIAGKVVNLGYRTKYLNNLASLPASLETVWASNPTVGRDLTTTPVDNIDPTSTDTSSTTTMPDVSTILVPIGLLALAWFLFK